MERKHISDPEQHPNSDLPTRSRWSLYGSRTVDVGNSKDTFSLVINFVKPSVLTRRKKISDPEQYPNSDQPTRSSPSDVGNQILESSLGDDLVKPSVIR